MPSIATVRPPRSAIPTLRKMVALKAAERRALLQALDQQRDLSSVAELQATVAAALPSLEDTDVRALVFQMFGLLALAYSHGYPVEDVAAQVSQFSELELTRTTKASFTRFLTELLASPSIVGIAKATDLANEHDHVFHTCRILTDIRPIFDQAAESPVGAVVTHRLRIEYFERGSVKSIEFALDEADMNELRESLDREERKAVAAQRLLAKAELPRFRVTETE